MSEESTNGDLYELHWNNHSHVLKGTFDVFRSGNELIDVTFSFGGGKKLGAHKIVLSACSEYFLELFRDNPCQHPIIIMTEIGYEPMMNIIEFMYTGEINIQIEHLDKFLKMAETLQIKGLTIQNDPNKNETHLINGKKRNMITEKTIESKRPKKQTTNKEVEENKERKAKEKNEELFIVNEDQKLGIIDLDLLAEDSVEFSYDVNGQTEYSDISSLSPKDGGNKILSSYPCPHCKKIFNHYISLKLHLPSHSGDTSCSLCGAVLGRKYDLKVHMRRKHNVNLDGSPALNSHHGLEYVQLPNAPDKL